MVLKVFKAVWFLSVVIVLADLLWVYASLPERVIVQETTQGRIEVDRNGFFYIVMTILALCNALVYATPKLFRDQEDFRTWFYGLIISLNIFFVVGMSLINLYNSAEHFDYPRIGFIIYGSVLLVIGWAMSWPVYKIFKGTTAKQVV
jgi:cytochrome c biogenesis factor